MEISRIQTNQIFSTIVTFYRRFDKHQEMDQNTGMLLRLYRLR